MSQSQSLVSCDDNHSQNHFHNNDHNRDGSGEIDGDECRGIVGVNETFQLGDDVSEVHSKSEGLSQGDHAETSDLKPSQSQSQSQSLSLSQIRPVSVDQTGLNMNVLLGPLLQLREKEHFGQRKSPLQRLKTRFYDYNRNGSPPPQQRVQTASVGSKRTEETTASAKDENGAVSATATAAAAVAAAKKIEEADGDCDQEKATRSVFCELAELHIDTSSDVMWRECARWIKFEEDVEEGGERWSKPHVATLSLHSLMELRCCFVNPATAVLLNLEAFTIEQVADKLMEEMETLKSAIDGVTRERIRNLILLRHAHLFSMRRAHNKERSVTRSFADIGHRLSSSTRDLRDKEAKEQVVQSDSASVTETKSNQSHGRKTSGTAAASTLDSNLHGSVQSVANDSVSSVTEGGATSKHGEKLPRESKASGFLNSAVLASDDVEAAAHATVKFDTHFMKKIPAGAEAANILVGEVDFLETQFAAFIRLTKAVILGDLTEVPVPTRFIFILLLPKTASDSITKHREIGRSIATLLSDEIFHDVAYKANNRDDLLVGMDEFLSNVTVIPPGEWDPTIRIEPPENVPSQQQRKEGAVLVLGGDQKEGANDENGHCSDESLHRSGRCFGGLVADFWRKKPWFVSDFRDGLHVQSIAAIVFLYFACLAPTVTFGGMLNVYLDGYMATMESILAASLCGVVFALFAGQPLIILGSTGPVLIFEKIVYDFAKANDLAVMSCRLWIGIWITVMLLIAVAFDLSYLVRYITRFTEESFSCLVALIFIVEAFAQLRKIGVDFPVVTDPLQMYNQYSDSPPECACIGGLDREAFDSRAFLNDSWLSAIAANVSLYPSASAFTIKLKLTQTRVPLTLEPYLKVLAARGAMITSGAVATGFNVSQNSTFSQLAAISSKDCSVAKSRYAFGKDCTDVDYVPDVFFFSTVLFIGTFVISYAFKVLKTSRFFRAWVRELLSDFAVVIAILIMTVLDLLVGLNTPKLDVPTKFQPTLVDRGWFISPFASKVPAWFIFAAIIPASLATILIFMDQQISAVIVNRKENKLMKGVGYHLDLLVLGILILICSFLGLPWFVASTVPSINHVMALRKESRCNAPGERPKYLGCRENRLTGLVIAILTGLSIFLTGVLKLIPMPVLYGVFLVMGTSCLNGIELVHRVFILLMPSKNQPDYLYLRNVRAARVHLFTAIQVVSIGAMWAIKSIEQTAIAFPLLVLAMCFVRKALDYVFTQRELRYLDDIIPEEHKREEEHNHVVSELLLNTVGHLEVPLPDGKVIAIKVDSVTYGKDGRKFNLGDHVNETKIWKDLINENASITNTPIRQSNPSIAVDGDEQQAEAEQDPTKLLLGVPNERRPTTTGAGLWVKHKKRVVDLLKIRTRSTDTGRSMDVRYERPGVGLQQNPDIAIDSI